MTLTKVQREILTTSAAAPFGEISRWDVDGSRFRTLRALVREGYLDTLDGGWFRITTKGRKAVEA